MDIKTLTDRVFDLHPLLYRHAYSELSQPEETATQNISERLRPLLEKELHAILPVADYWFRQQPRPVCSKYTWVISPYIQRPMGTTYTSIALLQNDTLLIGVVFDYETWQIVTGEKGDGAYRFDKKLQVSRQPLQAQSTYWAFPNLTEPLLTIKEPERIQRLTRNVRTRPVYNRTVENLATALINVASGRLDFTYAENFVYPDVAAAICIIEAAGGRCTDFSGSTEKLFSGKELFGSNSAIHEVFMED